MHVDDNVIVSYYMRIRGDFLIKYECMIVHFIVCTRYYLLFGWVNNFQNYFTAENEGEGVKDFYTKCETILSTIRIRYSCGNESIV